jgi:hypothetical protein
MKCNRKQSQLLSILLSYVIDRDSVWAGLGMGVEMSVVLLDKIVPEKLPKLFVRLLGLVGR